MKLNICDQLELCCQLNRYLRLFGRLARTAADPVLLAAALRFITQVSDAILDACLEQDPLSKVRSSLCQESSNQSMPRQNSRSSAPSQQQHLLFSTRS
jgi:hypothetical protein